MLLDLKKKKKKGIGGRKRDRSVSRAKVKYSSNVFFLLFYSRRVIYRGRQRRQKFASTAKGDQPFEGSTFFVLFFPFQRSFHARELQFKGRIIGSSKRKIRISVKKEKNSVLEFFGRRKKITSYLILPVGR